MQQQSCESSRTSRSTSASRMHREGNEWATDERFTFSDSSPRRSTGPTDADGTKRCSLSASSPETSKSSDSSGFKKSGMGPQQDAGLGAQVDRPDRGRLAPVGWSTRAVPDRD